MVAPDACRTRRFAPLNPAARCVDTSLVAIHEPMTEVGAAAVASCPLCRERFEVPADYKAHLAEIHALIDDAGTDTEAVVAPPPPPAPDPEPPAPPTKAEVKAEAKARVREAKEAKETKPARAPRPLRPARATRLPLLSHLRLPEVDAGGRYPLALRYGDGALYAPGALLVLAGVGGRGSDAVSLTMAIFGAVLVMTGMLLPILHRRFFDAAEPAMEAPAAPTATEASPVPQPEPAPAAAPTLEEVLLSLPTKREPPTLTSPSRGPQQ